MTQTVSRPAAGHAQPALGVPSDLPRMLGDFGDAASGPTLVLIGGLHGNEPAGVDGIRRVFDRLRADECVPQGRIVGLVGNRAALSAGKRFLESDLNRVWLPETLQRVRREGSGLEDEDLELAELDRHFKSIIKEARKGDHGPLHVLDLHTVSGPGPAFTVLHDTLANRRFARALPLPLALGLEEEISGTLTDYLTDHGAVALTVEAGQHEDPASSARAASSIWIAMEVAGVLPDCYKGDLDAAKVLLGTEGDDLPHAVEVRYRYPVEEEGHFIMNPGFRSFQHVREGRQIATDRGEEVTVPQNGLLVMPLYQEQGDDGFFMARRVQPIWLDLSTKLRHMRAERLIHWLPGVKRIPEQPGAFLVNKRVARILALELFHLLGFRRREHSDRFLVMERRDERAV